MKMKCVFVYLLLFFVLNSVVFAAAKAQDAENEKGEEAETKIESFLSKKGQIVVKDFETIEYIRGKYGIAEIETLIISDPSNKSIKVKGLRVEVTEEGRLERKKTAFLDIDEVESLSKALGYIIDLAEKWKDTSRPYSEVVFSTRGGFQIGFYQKHNALDAFLSSGHINKATCFLSSVSELKRVKESIDKGLQKLNGQQQ